jgi:hypothetical protein
MDPCKPRKSRTDPSAEKTRELEPSAAPATAIAAAAASITAPTAAAAASTSTEAATSAAPSTATTVAAAITTAAKTTTASAAGAAGSSRARFIYRELAAAHIDFVSCLNCGIEFVFIDIHESESSALDNSRVVSAEGGEVFDQLQLRGRVGDVPHVERLNCHSFSSP